MSVAASAQLIERARRGLEARLRRFAMRLQNDCLWFIRRWVQIEDPDAEGTAIPFRLWPAQERVLQVFLTARLVIVLKARQLGLTWLALAYATWQMLRRGGYSVIAISRREDDAKKLVHRVEFILRHLPAWIIRPAEDGWGLFGSWEATTERVVIHHTPECWVPGEDSTFEALPSSPDTGRSLAVSLLLMDEWAIQQYARELWQGAYPAVNRPTGGQVIGISTGRRGTLFHEIWEAAKAGLNGFVTVFLNWRADPRRTDAWYEQTKRDLPTSYRQEYPETEADAFSAGEGAAFPEWYEDVHIFGARDWYPNPDVPWRLYVAYDPGYMTRACALWFAVHPDGWAVCYREYYPTRVIDPIQAEEIRALSVRPDGQREQIAAYFAPPDAWLKKSDSGKSTADIFREHGIILTQVSNDRKQGWRRLHEWLQPLVGEDGHEMARLRFTRACQTALRVFPAATQDKNNPEEVDFEEDHVLDACRYFVMGDPRGAPTVRVHRRRPAAARPRSEITGY